MARASEHEPIAAVNARAHPTGLRGDLGQRGERVQERKRLRRLLEARDPGGAEVAQLEEALVLGQAEPLLGA